MGKGLAIVLPFHACADPERREITRKVFCHYRRVCDRLGCILIGVGSEGDLSRELFCRYHPPDRYFEYDCSGWDDLPDCAGSVGLADKFNRALEYAARWQPSHYATVGSDDLLAARFFERAYRSSAGMVGPTHGVNIYEASSGRHVWWDGKLTNPRWQHLRFTTSSVVLTHDALDRIGWEPWFSGPHEGYLEDVVDRAGVDIEAVDPECYWMVKGSQVLNSVELMERSGLNIVPAAPVAVAAFDAYWTSL